MTILWIIPADGLQSDEGWRRVIVELICYDKLQGDDLVMDWGYMKKGFSYNSLNGRYGPTCKS